MADEFAEALGQLCWNFSITEAQIKFVLYRVMGIMPNIGNAALSGIKINEMMSVITRLGDAQKWSDEQKNEWTYIQSQLGIITALRNNILHYGAYRLGSDYIVSNQQVIHIPERLSAIKISRQTLLNASHDLAQADVKINLLFRMQELEPTQVEHLKKALTSSWRYKQPPQASIQGKTQNKPPKPQSPQKPSRRSQSPPDAEKCSRPVTRSAHYTLCRICHLDNRQRFVWKGLEQNTRVLEKLGKRLEGRLYSATVGSGRQQPPIALDRQCEERSCDERSYEATQG